MLTTLLVHGGLWEDMDAERFWVRTGVVEGLRERGLHVVAPDRPYRALSWRAEVEHLARFLPGGPVCVVAGSNGCSVGARLAVEHPEAVSRLLLAWPATAGDVEVDTRTRKQLGELGSTAETADALLDGETLRGVADADLAQLGIPVGVLPSAPENPYHRGRTVDELLRLLPAGAELPGFPEPPRPDFPTTLPAFIDTVAAFALDTSTRSISPLEAGPA